MGILSIHNACDFHCASDIWDHFNTGCCWVVHIMIRCVRCGEPMKNYDDINNCAVRIDFMSCPLCQSKAVVTYGDHGRYVDKVEWTRRSEVNEY